VDHVFAGIHVSRLAESRRFYEGLLGREPDLVPNGTEAAWELRDGAWICLIADSQAAGGALHTLLVADLDSFLAQAASRGIGTGPLEPVGGMRQSVIMDPDGNRLKVAGA
jgi:catechol 2,3-dioxygenase-like lactoylglutathione lyase family enzyme